MKKLIPICLMISGLSQIGFGQSVGPSVPLGYATSGMGSGWANLMGVQFVDNSPAYADLAQYPTCNNFMCYYSNIASFTSFGFSIPATATIMGIKLDILQRVSSPGGGIHDSVLVLAYNGITYGSNYAATTFNWLDVPTIKTYGGAIDTWGYAWTPAQINDPTFGFRYQLTNTSFDQPASVDHLTMTVYYQVGTGLADSQTATPWQVAFTGSFLSINAQASTLSEGSQITVNSITGEKVYQSNNPSGNDRIDLKIDASTWNAGVYMVNIQPAGGKWFQKKLVLVK